MPKIPTVLMVCFFWGVFLVSWGLVDGQCGCPESSPSKETPVRTDIPARPPSDSSRPVDTGLFDGVPNEKSKPASSDIEKLEKQYLKQGDKKNDTGKDIATEKAKTAVEQKAEAASEKFLEDEQFEREKGWFGEKAATLFREWRKLDKEHRTLERQKEALEEQNKSLTGNLDRQRGAFKQQEQEFEKTKGELAKAEADYKAKIEALEKQAPVDRLKEATDKTVRKYREKYGENWNKDEKLSSAASQKIFGEVDRLTAEHAAKLKGTKEEAKEAAEAAKEKLDKAENAAKSMKSGVERTEKEIAKTCQKIDETETKLKDNEKAQKKNEKQCEELARQEKAREAERQRKEEAASKKEEEAQKKAAKPAPSPTARGGEFDAQIRLAQMRLKAMKIFMQMYAWDNGKKIKPASGYEGSADFSGKVDSAGKALQLGVKTYGEGIKGLGAKASPAGDVIGTLRNSLDAVGETYNLMSQAFTTQTNLGAGRFYGAYENMTSFDDAASATGVTFDSSRERELIERMVLQLAR